MRVAFVLSALQAGGAERVIALISAAVVARGWDATIITFDHPGDPVYHRYDPRVRLCRLGLPPGQKGLRAPVQMLRRIRALRREFRDGGHDVVVSFLTKVNVLSLIASFGTRIPVMVSERNNPALQPSHPLWLALLDRLYPRAAAIVMLTEASKACLPPALRGEALAIPNPVRIEPVAPPRDDGRTLTAVGRLTHQKGFDMLLDAFAAIAPRHPEWRLEIWGEGPDRIALEAQRDALGLADRVRFPGTTARPRGWTESTTIFVLSSRYEGWANVVAEAMAAGLPVASFDCDYGPADLLKDGVTGLLVPVNDTRRLADAIERLIDEPATRTRIGSAARADVARFDVDTITDAWLRAIRRVGLRENT